MSLYKKYCQGMISHTFVRLQQYDVLRCFASMKIKYFLISTAIRMFCCEIIVAWTPEDKQKSWKCCSLTDLNWNTIMPSKFFSSEYSQTVNKFHSLSFGIYFRCANVIMYKTHEGLPNLNFKRRLPLILLFYLEYSWKGFWFFLFSIFFNILSF